MDKKIEVTTVVIDSNISDETNKIISDKVSMHLPQYIRERLLELDDIFDCKHYYKIEFFFNIKNLHLQRTKIEANDVTFARIINFFKERFSPSAYAYTLTK